MDALLPGLAAVENVHPLLVHFPIALWSAALLFWLLGLRRREEFWRAGRWLLYLGTLSAWVAVATGLWAADRLGHDTPGHDLVHVHRDFMLAATVIGTATAALAWRLRVHPSAWARRGLLGALALTAVVCAVGADRGALLVYGHGIGTQLEDTAASLRFAPGEHAEPGRPASPEPEAEHDHGDHTH